jgi:hypothetical protein
MNPAFAFLTVAGLATFACKPTASPITAPTPAPSAATPSVNVSSKGPILNGQSSIDYQWGGDMSWKEQSAVNTLGLSLEQTGAQVTGNMFIYGPDGGAGPLAGIVSGNTFSFNFSIGNQGQGCGNTGSGAATITADTMTGTFSGKRCNGDTYTNGTFKVTLPYPFRAAPYPLAGTWVFNVPAVAGGGRWTFNISQTTTDVTGGTLSGSVDVSGSSLNLGPGTMTATNNNKFPGPTEGASMKVSFTGACASNFTLGLAIEGSNPVFYGGTFMAGGLNGTTCNEQVPQTSGVNLVRQ